MSQTIGEFDFLVLQMKKGDQMPFNPHIEIVLKDKHRFTASDEKRQRLSGHLMTEGEIDEQIKAMKDDLDAVGERAKLALLQAQSATLDRARK